MAGTFAFSGYAMIQSAAPSTDGFVLAILAGACPFRSAGIANKIRSARDVDAVNSFGLLTTRSASRRIHLAGWTKAVRACWHSALGARDLSPVLRLLFHVLRLQSVAVCGEDRDCLAGFLLVSLSVRRLLTRRVGSLTSAIEFRAVRKYPTAHPRCSGAGTRRGLGTGTIRASYAPCW